MISRPCASNSTVLIKVSFPELASPENHLSLSHLTSTNMHVSQVVLTMVAPLPLWADPCLLLTVVARLLWEGRCLLPTVAVLLQWVDPCRLLEAQ